MCCGLQPRGEICSVGVKHGHAMPSAPGIAALPDVGHCSVHISRCHCALGNVPRKAEQPFVEVS